MDRSPTKLDKHFFFLYKLTMQNLDEILLHKHCKDRASIVIYFWSHKKSRKKKIKKKENSKIKEDTHEESPKDCPSWWWMTKMTSEKVEGLECTRLTKSMTQFWLTKDPFSESICIWGKEIEIWIRKDLMSILKGLINFIEDLIVRKINFFESIWVLIGRNCSSRTEIELWKV